jgi:NADH:ubiquinone reductase (H+-translocating)
VAPISKHLPLPADPAAVGDDGGILIIGSGFAGVWAAAAASRVRADAGLSDRDLPITVVSDRQDLVIRPRLYEADPRRMRVPLRDILDPAGVRQVHATVTGVIPPAGRGPGRGDLAHPDGAAASLGFARLVLAAGSRVTRPDVPGAASLFDVDTLAGATRLDQHLHRLVQRPASPARDTVVVIGAGFAGIELATTLPSRLRTLAPGRPVRVVLVEAAAVVGPVLGDGPRPVIEQALDDLGVQVMLGRRLTRVGPADVELSDGSVIETATAIWTGGLTASPLTSCISGARDDLGRLVVDQFLRVPGAPAVFAAGDTAAAEAPDGHRVLQSCQHAIPLGKFAGHNAASDLLGRPLERFDPGPYLTCLDLGDAGAVATAGWDREIRLTGEAAKAMKKAICETFIYPPVNDADALMAEAGRRPHPAVLV